jgi:hypothetical protein
MTSDQIAADADAMPAFNRVPRDSFPIRLAITRAYMDWNYDQAERSTGINSESWRVWEKGRRHCSDVAGVARKIQAATGLSYQWLMLGGPLEEEAPMPEPPAWAPRGSNPEPTDYKSALLLIEPPLCPVIDLTERLVNAADELPAAA